MEKFLTSREKGFAVVRTKDYSRVLGKIVKVVQQRNVELGTEVKLNIFGQGIETFEGVTFDKDQLIKDIKSGLQVVYIFRNFCPLTEDEVVQFVEKYVQKEHVGVKIIIVDPTYKIPQQVEPHVEEFIDFFPKKEEVGGFYVEGLTSVELKKAQEEGDAETYRENILKKSGSILEILKPDDVDTPVGLDEPLDLIESIYKSGIGRGTLLLGVPGTGKTLMAKFLAKKYPVIKFNLGAVYNKYVGGTEERLRTAFETLKQFGDSFVFIDEFEKLMATGGGDSGVSKRVLGEILAWLQDKETNNYVLATMNDLTNLPLELVRPGRWDFTFGLLPPPASTRESIIEYYARKYKLDIDSQLVKVQNLTPADISAIYRLGSVVGLQKAKKFVKLTKDIATNFEATVDLIKKYSVPVYQEQVEDLF